MDEEDMNSLDQLTRITPEAYDAIEKLGGNTEPATKMLQIRKVIGLPTDKESCVK
jgi:hypothetical protein